MKILWTWLLVYQLLPLMSIGGMQLSKEFSECFCLLESYIICSYKLTTIVIALFLVLPIHISAVIMVEYFYLLSHQSLFMFWTVKYIWNIFLCTLRSLDWGLYFGLFHYFIVLINLCRYSEYITNSKFWVIYLFWYLGCTTWRIYKNGQVVPADNSLDYGANFSHMLGFDDPKMLELMRLYVTIHT